MIIFLARIIFFRKNDNSDSKRNRSGAFFDSRDHFGKLGYSNVGITSEQVSYRPPERRSVDSDRPRRAGRKKKLRSVSISVFFLKSFVLLICF